MHVHVRHLSQDSTFDLRFTIIDFNFLANFFPKFELPNSGCGLSVNAAYTPVFMVVEKKRKIPSISMILRRLTDLSEVRIKKKKGYKRLIKRLCIIAWLTGKR